MMTQITEAVYAGGVLKPENPLDLPDNQRVRVIVQPIGPIAEVDREAAIKCFLEGVDRMDFHLKGPLPTREELHDRSL